jgi:hypothetical protein
MSWAKAVAVNAADKTAVAIDCLNNKDDLLLTFIFFSQGFNQVLSKVF